jgi:hypothetical protein
MDKKTVFIKTAKGESEGADLSSDLKRIISLIDNKSTVDELAKRAPPSLREGCRDILGELAAGGYIRDKNQPIVEPKIATPKFNPLKMFVPKPTAAPTQDLDFHTMNAVPAQQTAEQVAKQKVEEAARGRADLEAAVATAKARANAEAAAKAEARIKQEAEIAAHAKALAAADAAVKAEAKAKKDAEIEARARAVAEANAQREAEIRAQAVAKAKQELVARMQAQQEAERNKAALEAAVRARAEIEAAARAQQMAEAKAKQEAAARMQAQQEAARAKAELEVAARAKAKAEEEARVRAEIEAAARAQQVAEAKAKLEAEAARLKAEQEVARLRAEQEALRIQAELEAAAKAKAEAEAEAARLRAELEAARIRAEQEAAAKIRAEAEIKAAAEALARQQLAEAAARREQEALLRVVQEGEAPASDAPEFEIDLDSFQDGAEPQPRTVPAHYAVQAGAEAQQETERPEATAEVEKTSVQDIAAEMARLKNEAEVARRQSEEEARRQAEEQALAEEQSKAWAEAEQRARVQTLIETGQATQQAALSQAREIYKPSARKRRKPLPLGKIAFGLITLALVVAVVLPYVYPLEEYIAPLEQRLSARLKQPVHIGGISASSVPPKLQLQKVTAGIAQEVKVGSIVLSFDPLSLLSDIKVIDNAELQDVIIQGDQLDKQAASLKLLGGDAQYPVRHLTLNGVKIVTDEIALPLLSGIADIDVQGRFNRIALHSADDKLGFDLQSNQGRWQLEVNMKESSLILLPDVVFNDLSAKGDLSDGEVNFTEMDAHIFNGILLGSAKLNWQKGWQLQGHLEAKMFELKKMFPKYGVDGEMSGEATFALTGAKLSQIDDAPRLDGSFAVKRGTINGFDVVETARLLSRENMSGGRTRFDDMIGLVQLESHTCHFRQLKIISEMLSAKGQFDVSPSNQLSGNINAEIKMHPGNNALSVYGTLAEPKMRAGH